MLPGGHGSDMPAWRVLLLSLLGIKASVIRHIPTLDRCHSMLSLVCTVPASRMTAQGTLAVATRRSRRPKAE